MPPDPQTPSPDVPGGVEATPEEQQQYEETVQALSMMIYDDEKATMNLMQFIATTAEQESPTIALAKATMMVITETDKKIDIPEVVLFNIVDDTYYMLSDLAIEGLQLEVSDEDMVRGVAASIQLVMQSYGVTKEEWMDYVGSIDEAGAQKLVEALGVIQ